MRKWTWSMGLSPEVGGKATVAAQVNLRSSTFSQNAPGPAVKGDCWRATPSRIPVTLVGGLGPGKRWASDEGWSAIRSSPRGSALTAVAERWTVRLPVPLTVPLVATERGHAFVYDVREGTGDVDSLTELLRDAGIPVWRDTESRWPGEDWRGKLLGRPPHTFEGCGTSHAEAFG